MKDFKKYLTNEVSWAVNKYREKELDSINKTHQDMYDKIDILHSLQYGHFEELTKVFDDLAAYTRFNKALREDGMEQQGIQEYILESLKEHLLDMVGEPSLEFVSRYRHHMTSPIDIQYEDKHLATYDVAKGLVHYKDFSKAVGSIVESINAKEDRLLKDRNTLKRTESYAKSRFSWIKAIKPAHEFKSYREATIDFFKVAILGHKKRQRNLQSNIDRQKKRIVELESEIAEKNGRLDEVLNNKNKIIELQDGLRKEFKILLKSS